MLKKYTICLLIGIFTMACAAYGDKKQAPVTDTAAESATQREQSSNWRSFKGVLLRHIVANCCFSDTQNTVVLGQDTNSDGQVDKCYQLKGTKEKTTSSSGEPKILNEIYYRTIACPDNLAPVERPKEERHLCRGLTLPEQVY